MFTTFEDLAPEYDKDNMWYLCYQAEKCPETSKPHWQCYVEFKQPQRGAGALRLLGRTGHLCVRSGTRDQAVAYCKKEESAAPGSFREYGEADRLAEAEVKTQGRRSDLNEVAQAIQDGSQPDEVAEAYPASFIRYHRGIERFHQAVNRDNKRRYWTSLIIIWGPPGTGKSRQVWAREGYDNVYPMPERDRSQPVWFDGYKGERAVLIDDYEPGDYPLGRLLRWADRYPLQVPTKGGHRQFVARRLYITSNHDPAFWFPSFNGDIPPALSRRIEEGGGEIIHQEEIWEPDSDHERDNEAAGTLQSMSGSPRPVRGGPGSQNSDVVDLTQDEDE